MTSFAIYTVKKSDSSSKGNHQIIYNTFRQFYAYNSPICFDTLSQPCFLKKMLTYDI